MSAKMSGGPGRGRERGFCDNFLRAMLPSECCSLLAFELRADQRDLTLDGRHWRELFGGSIGDAPKLGALFCCSPTTYVLYRVMTAAAAICILTLRLVTCHPCET